MGAELLTVSGLRVVYDNAVLALRGLDLALEEGEVVALLGPNGAGKTTLLRAVTGLLGTHRARIVAGEIHFDGQSIAGCSAPQIVGRGIAQVMEGRRLFAELTVDENLRLGAFTRRSRAEVREAYARVLDLFPRLAERRRSVAGYLSGGEQQMVAMGRALMAAPRLLLLDEPSLGLAPKMVAAIGELIAEINRQGTTVLLVEQNVRMALSVASRAYVLESGLAARSGTAAELAGDDRIRRLYLGGGTLEHAA